MDYDIISFDLDGTLVETAGEIAEAVNRALEQHGIARRPDTDIVPLIGAGTQELMRRLHERLLAEDAASIASVPLDQLLHCLDGHYEATTGTTAQPYPGAMEMLTRLKAAGLRLACTTNKEHRHAVRVLESQRMLPMFDLVIGGDSLPFKKPDARVLAHVVKALNGVPWRTAHLGDSKIDVQSARASGVSAWAVPYGYNAGVPIAQAQPDRLFDRLSDVTAHVLREPMVA
jgi:phosphoglycolate phosphatase